ncbi:MAG: RNA polymerase sigma factor [Rariglobus sp.]
MITQLSSAPQPAAATTQPEASYGAFAEHYQDVTAYAASRARLGDEVRDVVQEAYLRVFKLRNPERIRTPKRFLFRTVRNLILDRVRKQQVRDRYAALDTDSVETVPDVAPTPALVACDRERRALLEAAAATLPERTREIFILNAYAHMSYSEIADHMGLSKTAVAKHLTRAIATVTAALGDTPSS